MSTLDRDFPLSSPDKSYFHDFRRLPVVLWAGNALVIYERPKVIDLIKCVHTLWSIKYLYWTKVAAADKFSRNSRHRLWPSRSTTCACALSHRGIASATASRPRIVSDNCLVRRSSPGAISMSPALSSGLRSRARDVRSITNSSAKCVMVVDPANASVTRTGSWVDRTPDGFRDPSNTCVTARDALRRFRQAQVFSISSHLARSNRCCACTMLWLDPWGSLNKSIHPLYALPFGQWNDTRSTIGVIFWR